MLRDGVRNNGILQLRGARHPQIELETEPGIRISCVLLGFEAGEMHVLADRAFPDSFPVIVHLTRISIEGKVSYCRASDGFFRICIGTKRDERRQEPRFPLNDPCTATVLRDNGHQTFEGHLTDISRWGMGIRVKGALPVGCMIYVETDKLVISGEIRHCNEAPDGDSVAGLVISDIVCGVPKNLPAHVLLRLAKKIRHPGGSN